MNIYKIIKTPICFLSHSIKSVLSVRQLSVSITNNYEEPTKEDWLGLAEPLDFTGKVALVTGSSSGLGRAIVKSFSAVGAHVVVTSNEEEAIKSVAQECQTISPKNLKPLEVVAEVTKREDLKNLVDITTERLGRIDFLINNVGIAEFPMITEEDFMPRYYKIMKVNVSSLLELTYLAIPHLLKTKGNVTNISSIAGTAPMAYAMSKASINMMTKELALVLGPLGIRVNTISPGAIMTPALLEVPNYKVFAERTPLKRIGHTLEVAKGVLFLASKNGSFINGAELVIDGGFVHNFVNSY